MSCITIVSPVSSGCNQNQKPSKDKRTGAQEPLISYLTHNVECAHRYKEAVEDKDKQQDETDGGNERERRGN